jgi:DNA-binding winged helix-turn-helix (wHTH) protein
LITCLARKGHAGATLEEIHRAVWGGKTFHPLKHRNAVYVAIARLRECLAGLVDGPAVVEPVAGRYRLEAKAVVVSRLDNRTPTQRISRPPEDA